MKKLMSIVILAVITAGFAVAGGSSSRQRLSEDEITVMLLTDASGVDDRSFNAAAWRGILEFYGDTWENQRGRGRLYDIVAAQTQDMHVPNLRLATEQGHNLVVATGFPWSAAISEVALQNPNQNYLIVDFAVENIPNLMGTIYAEHEGSFLVGAAAALKSIEDGISNPVFGFIGGIPNNVITRFHVGYVQGVLSVLPNARFVDFYANDWGRPDLGKTQAMNWFNSDVYAIFSAAGPTGNGAIAQAREYREAGRNVWAIGVDSDQHEEGIYSGNQSAVLTSMVKVVESSLLYALNAVRNNNFRGGTTSFDLAGNGVGYTTTNSAMTSGIVNQLEEKRRQIIGGQIKVAPTLREAMAIPGFPQNLQAKDD